MSKKNLAIYLKDHFAGSEAALAILDHIEAVHGSGPAATMARTLRPQFEGERDVLKELLLRLNDETSAPRRVFGWLSEKGLELKLKVDDAGGGALHLLEAVEALAIGVHGKRGLWVALGASRTPDVTIPAVDYDRLTRQADEQRSLIELVRLGAALKVINDNGG